MGIYPFHNGKGQIFVLGEIGQRSVDILCTGRMWHCGVDVAYLQLSGLVFGGQLAHAADECILCREGQ